MTGGKALLIAVALLAGCAVPIDNSIGTAWRPFADVYALTVQGDERIGGVCPGSDEGASHHGRDVRA